MFDSAPSNLPLEPAAAPMPPVQPRPVPRRDVPTPTPMVGGSSGAKEPEDIFSAVGDASAGGSGAGGSSSMDEMPELQDHPRHPMGKIIAMVFGVFLLVAGLGGGAYYFFVLRPAAQQEAKALADALTPKTTQTETPVGTSPVTNQPNIPPAETNTPIEPASTNTPSETVQTPPNIPPPTSIQSDPVVPPTIQRTSIVDTDGDGLTDAEETVLGTNPAVADTDGDTFADGAELRGLYSPAAKGASITAMPSIKVVRWASVTFLMPSSWNLIDQTTVTATIQTSTGERFILTMNDAAVPSPVSGSSMTTKNNLQATAGSDGISGDVRLGSTRLVITPADPNMSAAYRTLLYVLLESVRLAQ